MYNITERTRDCLIDLSISLEGLQSVLQLSNHVYYIFTLLKTVQSIIIMNLTTDGGINFKPSELVKHFLSLPVYFKHNNLRLTT